MAALSFHIESVPPPFVADWTSALTQSALSVDPEALLDEALNHPYVVLRCAPDLRLPAEAIGCVYQMALRVVHHRLPVLIVAAPFSVQQTLGNLLHRLDTPHSIAFVDSDAEATQQCKRLDLQMRLSLPVPFRTSPTTLPIEHPRPIRPLPILVAA